MQIFGANILYIWLLYCPLCLSYNYIFKCIPRNKISLKSNQFISSKSIITTLFNQFGDSNDINSKPIFPECLLMLGLTEQQLEIIDEKVLEQSPFSNYPIIVLDNNDMKKPLEYYLNNKQIELRDHIMPDNMKLNTVDIPLMIFSGINQSNFQLFIEIISKIRKYIPSIMFATVVANALKKNLGILYLEIRNDHEERNKK